VSGFARAAEVVQRGVEERGVSGCRRRGWHVRRGAVEPGVRHARQLMPNQHRPSRARSSIWRR
jgi:hypothetical protein